MQDTNRSKNARNEGECCHSSAGIGCVGWKNDHVGFQGNGSSPLSVQERVKRLEDSVKAVEVGRLEIGTHALSGSNDWLMDRIYALERTVDDLQVDLRDNLLWV